MAEGTFFPYFQVSFEEEADAWAVVVGRQRFAIANRETAFETGLVTITSPWKQPIQEFRSSNPSDDPIGYGGGEIVTIGYASVQETVSACFRGQMAGLIARWVGLPNGRGEGVWKMRERIRLSLAKRIGKILPVFPVKPQVREAHRWLFSVTGRPPTPPAVEGALALPHREDLRFLACRSVLVRGGRYYPNPYGSDIEASDWTNLVLGKPLRGFARRLLYGWPGGLPIDTLFAVVGLADAHYLYEVPPTRTHWFMLSHVREPGERLKRAVRIIMQSSQGELLDALGLRNERSLPTRYVILMDLRNRAENLWHYGDLTSLAEAVRACDQQGPQEWWGRYYAQPGLTFPVLLRQPPRGWRYLDSSDAFNEEGQTMRHCAASYAGECAAGLSCVFHRDGPPALTIQVSGDYIVQAHGKANSSPLEAIERASEEWDAWVRRGPWRKTR